MVTVCSAVPPSQLIVTFQLGGILHCCCAKTQQTNKKPSKIDCIIEGITNKKKVQSIFFNSEKKKFFNIIIILFDWFSFEVKFTSQHQKHPNQYQNQPKHIYY